MVEVYNEDLTIKYTEGSYLIEILLDSILLTSGLTLNGEKAFTSLSLDMASTGDHQIIARSDYFSEGSTDWFTIENIYMCIKLTSSNVLSI